MTTSYFHHNFFWSFFLFVQIVKWRCACDMSNFNDSGVDLPFYHMSNLLEPH